MSRLPLLALFALLPAPAVAADDGAWLGWLSSDLRALDAERRKTQADLAALGAPVIGQTPPQFGYQHPILWTPPVTPPWVQVDLGEEVPVDRIALIPAVLDWSTRDGKRTYGFPLRLRVDLASSPDFADPFRVADRTDEDVPDPGIAPLVVPGGGRRARYVRVTVTKLARDEAGKCFYALGELMVLSGRRDVAVGRPVTASSSLNLPPRWTLDALVDGRTALGPPIHIALLGWDGLFAGPATDGESTSMTLDLGAVHDLQEVRLYATHARLGADIPGFSFPARFRVQAAASADFAAAAMILDSTGADFPNPGDNAITVRTPGVAARYVRVSLPPGDHGRFSLSEVEVYSGDRNIARQATVTSSPDPSTYSSTWPRSLLVDGYTSYGRLMELPEWLDEWDRRAHLDGELARLAGERGRLVERLRARAWWLGGAAGALALAGLAAWLLALRRRRARELDGLRRRLARDLHDEIGSNLAAIARLSELGADAAPGTGQSEDWHEVGRIANESMDGMREVLWLAGAREEAGPDLASHLQRLAERMLGGVAVTWTAPPAAIPADWTPAARRELFLIAKEALANIVRHAQARAVELGLAVDGGTARLEIRDHGRGFDPAAVRGGIGLASLRERARGLGGRLVIESAPGRGTLIRCTVPLALLRLPSAGVRGSAVAPRAAGPLGGAP